MCFPLQEFHACFNLFTCIPEHFFLPAANTLTRLFLCCNNLTAVPALDTPLLIELSLSNNKITKMEHLDCLPHLVRLDLRANRIHRLEGLGTSTQLQRFGAPCMCSHMHGNDVSISLAVAMTFFGSLSLSGNLLEDVSGKELPRLDRLAFLGLQGNMVGSPPTSPSHHHTTTLHHTTFHRQTKYLFHCT